MVIQGGVRGRGRAKIQVPCCIGTNGFRKKPEKAYISLPKTQTTAKDGLEASCAAAVVWLLWLASYGSLWLPMAPLSELVGVEKGELWEHLTF